MLKRQRILPKDHPYLKPQNHFSQLHKKRAISELKAWLVDFDIKEYDASLLAHELIHIAILERMEKTSPSAPSVYFSDKDKISSLITAGKKTATKLDDERQLESLLEQLQLKVDEFGLKSYIEAYLPEN